MTKKKTTLNKRIDLIRAFKRINDCLELTNTTLRETSIIHKSREFTNMVSWFKLSLKEFKKIYQNIIDSRVTYLMDWNRLTDYIYEVLKVVIE